MNTIKKICLLILLFLTKAISSNGQQVKILVNKGQFASYQDAAFGEDNVNFWDDNMEDDCACTECFAATELARFLPEATNIKSDQIEFGKPEFLPEEDIVFLLGSRFSNSLIKKIKPQKGETFDREQSFRIITLEENDRIITIIEGVDRIGTLYGVYRYLEELGIKFIGLGKIGTVFPRYPVDIPSDLNVNETPDYLTRGFYAWGDRKIEGNDFFLWMARNMLNYWTAENQPVHLLKKLGFKLTAGGHPIQRVIFSSDSEYEYNHPLFEGDEYKPDDPYKIGDEYIGDINNDRKLSTFEAHPEWYGMKNGNRIKISLSDTVPGAHDEMNFCTSNEDARREFGRRIAQSLIDGEYRYTDIILLWFFDAANLWCTCDKCKEDSLSSTDKMFLVTNDILKEVERARQEGRLNRRIEISNLAYIETLTPPTRALPKDYDYKNSSIIFFPIQRCYVHSFADPSCSEINKWLLDAYQGWTAGDNRFYKGAMCIGEYYNVSRIKSLPVIFTKIMAIDIPWYYRSGARHFNYMHTPHKLWGTWTLNQYLLGKLLWNIEINADVIIDDFFNLYYPTTHSSTAKFYKQLEIASANIKVLKHTVKIGPEDSYSGVFKDVNRLLTGNIFKIDHLHYNKYESLINNGPSIIEIMDAMELAKKYLEKSLIECKNTIEQKRLLEDAKRFDYGYATYKYLFHMIRTSIFHKKDNKNLAIREFAIAEKYAEQLENMIEIVQVSSIHTNSQNAFEATYTKTIFNEFKKLYGESINK
jgi:hypothetical protein